MDYTARFRTLLKEGWSRDDALGELRRAGASPIGCIKAIHEVEQVGLADAKRLFSESASWADVHRDHEKFADELDAVLSEFATAVTIYIPLRDEDVAVWRPVLAVHFSGDTYRIVSAHDEHPDEAWEFDRGDVVRCVDRILSGGQSKVAVARVSKQAG